MTSAILQSIKCSGPEGECVKAEKPSSNAINRLDLCLAHYRQALLRAAIERSQVLHKAHGERICRGDYQDKITRQKAARGCELAADEVASLQRALAATQV